MPRGTQPVVDRTDLGCSARVISNQSLWTMITENDYVTKTLYLLIAACLGFLANSREKELTELIIESNHEIPVGYLERSEIGLVVIF